MRPHYKEQSRHLEVVNDSALSLEAAMQERSRPAFEPRRARSGHQEAAGTVFVRIIKGILNDLDCIMKHQMLQARASDKKGEAV